MTRGKNEGGFSCEKSCPHWCSISICSHALATAAHNRETKQFVDWYCTHKAKTAAKLTNAIVANMAENPGKKPGAVRRKSKRASQAVTVREARIPLNMPTTSVTTQDPTQRQFGQQQEQQPGLHQQLQLLQQLQRQQQQQHQQQQLLLLLQNVQQQHPQRRLEHSQEFQTLQLSLQQQQQQQLQQQQLQQQQQQQQRQQAQQQQQLQQRQKQQRQQQQQPRQQQQQRRQQQQQPRRQQQRQQQQHQHQQ